MISLLAMDCFVLKAEKKLSVFTLYDYFNFDRLAFNLIFLFFTPYPEGESRKIDLRPMATGIIQVDFKYF